LSETGVNQPDSVSSVFKVVTLKSKWKMLNSDKLESILNSANKNKMMMEEEEEVEASPGSPGFTRDTAEMMRGISLDGGPRQWV